MRIAPVKHYLNLTNGIESLPSLPEGEPFGFVRIQSTACEQKRWDFLLCDLDADLLLNLAIGTRCVIHDYSSRKNVPRAIYQGVELIRYVLYRHWLRTEITCTVHKVNVTRYFSEVYRELKPPTLKRLAYYRKFLLTDCIRLDAMPGRTSHDGKYDFYRDVLAAGQHHAIYEEIA